MRNFVSYAHINLPGVKQLADLLQMGGHDVWYDQRLVGGQPWRDQLRSQIKSSECFVYVLTPQSVESLWCQWEFAQAVHMGKKIVTVLLEACERDGVLDEHQYVDFTVGNSLEAGLRLGTAVYAAESIPPERDITNIEPAQAPLVHQLYDSALQLYQQNAFSKAKDLLDDVLHIAPDYADAQQLFVLVTRRIAAKPRQAVAEKKDVHDKPVQKRETVRIGNINLKRIPFDWIEIPGKGYSIAKYPVANAQFARFIEAGGYNNRQWWTEAGWQRREKSDWKAPLYWQKSEWNQADHPVVGVSWYEAVAFCLWLSDITGENIMLPSGIQWQYAAQGENSLVYPWGNEWDSSCCNNSVDNLFRMFTGKTTSVIAYEGRGDSPFGVVDMAGNVFEWCLTDCANGSNDVNGNASKRVLHGGAWSGVTPKEFRCDYQDCFRPQSRDNYVGFRLARS